MNIEKRIHILKRLDLFVSLPDEELHHMAEDLEEIKLEPGCTLFAEGSTERDMYILTDGLLQIFKDNRTITNIAPLNYIGEMAIIEKKPRSATIMATAPSTLLKLTYQQFYKFISERPDSLLAIMRTLSWRIRKNTEMIAEEFEKANILIHDMRNSITGLMLMDLMDKDNLDDTAQRHIKLMQSCRDDLLEMTSEAMANAKRLQHKQQLCKNSLTDLITTLAASLSLHPDLKDKNIRLDLDSNANDFQFYLIDVRRLITNLLVNAGQACTTGDTITIKLFNQDNTAVVEVYDIGTGIPADIFEKIFKAHFTTKTDGNGLGLTSCKNIVEKKHCGTISCRPNAPQGTVFRFTLPLEAPPNT